MSNIGNIWMVALLILAVINVAFGGMTIFVRRKDGDQLSFDLSPGATVGDVFAVAASFGVQTGILRFGDAEHQDPSVSLADIGVCSETTVDIYPIPIRWTLENLDSRKPIFRAEIRTSGREEAIPIYLQWLPYLNVLRTRWEKKVEICTFMLVMADESNPSKFYRYRRLDTQQKRDRFPHYARLQDILDAAGVRIRFSSLVLPRMTVNIAGHGLHLNNSNVFPFEDASSLLSFPSEYNPWLSVMFKDVVFHNGKMADTNPMRNYRPVGEVDAILCVSTTLILLYLFFSSVVYAANLAIALL